MISALEIILLQSFPEFTVVDRRQIFIQGIPPYCQFWSISWNEDNNEQIGDGQWWCPSAPKDTGDRKRRHLEPKQKSKKHTAKFHWWVSVFLGGGAQRAHLQIVLHTLHIHWSMKNSLLVRSEERIQNLPQSFVEALDHWDQRDFIVGQARAKKAEGYTEGMAKVLKFQKKSRVGLGESLAVWANKMPFDEWRNLENIQMLEKMPTSKGRRKMSLDNWKLTNFFGIFVWKQVKVKEKPKASIWILPLNFQKKIEIEAVYVFSGIKVSGYLPISPWFHKGGTFCRPPQWKKRHLETLWVITEWW